MPDLDDLAAEFRTSSEFLQQADERVRSAAEINEARLGRDRSWIAYAIIGTYAVAIFSVIFYLLFWVPECSNLECAPETALWDMQAEYLMSLIFTAVVPIVTLMLGFYFGSEKSSAAQSDQK